MAPAKSKLSRNEAEEFSRNLGGVMTGATGLIDHAVNVLLVPQALDMTPDEWVQEHLGGYVRRSRDEIREAVKELDSMEDEHGDPIKRTAQQIAVVLGVSKVTVDRARQVIEAAKAHELSQANAEGDEPGAVDDAGELETTSRARTPETKAARQERVAVLLDEGKTQAEIAVVLDTSIPQIGKDIAAIRKQRAEDVAEDVADLLRDDLTSPDDIADSLDIEKQVAVAAIDIAKERYPNLRTAPEPTDLPADPDEDAHKLYLLALDFTKKSDSALGAIHKMEATLAKAEELGGWNEELASRVLHDISAIVDEALGLRDRVTATVPQ